MQILKWVLISRKEYERLKVAEQVLEAYRVALKITVEIACSVGRLVGA